MTEQDFQRLMGQITGGAGPSPSPSPSPTGTPAPPWAEPTAIPGSGAPWYYPYPGPSGNSASIPYLGNRFLPFFSGQPLSTAGLAPDPNSGQHSVDGTVMSTDPGYIGMNRGFAPIAEGVPAGFGRVPPGGDQSAWVGTTNNNQTQANIDWGNQLISDQSEEQARELMGRFSGNILKAGMWGDPTTNPNFPRFRPDTQYAADPGLPPSADMSPENTTAPFPTATPGNVTANELGAPPAFIDQPGPWPGTFNNSYPLPNNNVLQPFSDPQFSDLGPNIPASPDFGPSDQYLPTDYGPATVMEPSGSKGIYDPSSYAPYTDFGGGPGYNPPAQLFPGGQGNESLTTPAPENAVLDFTNLSYDPNSPGASSPFQYDPVSQDTSSPVAAPAPASFNPDIPVAPALPANFPTGDPTNPQVINPGDPNNNLTRGGVSMPLYPTKQDVFTPAQPRGLLNELGQPTDWAHTGQLFKDAMGNIRDVTGKIVSGVGDLANRFGNNIMNDPRNTDPAYLASMGYLEMGPEGSGFMLPQGVTGPPVGVNDVGDYGAINGGSYFHGGASMGVQHGATSVAGASVGGPSHPTDISAYFRKYLYQPFTPSEFSDLSYIDTNKGYGTWNNAPVPTLPSYSDYLSTFHPAGTPGSSSGPGGAAFDFFQGRGDKGFPRGMNTSTGTPHGSVQ